MVDTSQFYVKANGDPEGEIDWQETWMDANLHLENDDITHIGWDANGSVFTRCAEHPDLIQHWAEYTDPMQLATHALRMFIARLSLDDRTEGMWQRPAAALKRDRYNDEWLTWRDYTFTFKETDGNHFICDGLLIGKDYDLSVVEKLLKFVGTDVIQYLEYDDWI